MRKNRFWPSCASGKEQVSVELRKRYSTLTLRVREVMTAVIAGRPNKPVAGDIGVSEITEKVHRGQVMRKMRPSSLPDLARMADKLSVNQ